MTQKLQPRHSKKPQAPAPQASAEEPHPEHHHHSNEVYVLRDWKEYLGESLLIVFSVLLALFLTEFINNIHEKSDTREMLRNVKEELQKNKKIETTQYSYESAVISRIDSALKNEAFQKQILVNNEFQTKLLFPEGVFYGVNGDLSSAAWDVAKGHNIAGKINFSLMSQLTDLYEDQARILKLEDKVGSAFLSPESRNPANIRATLILIRDNFKGWSYDRTPGLIKRYDDAIKAIGSTE